jgi:hypothetical protein
LYSNALCYCFFAADMLDSSAIRAVLEIVISINLLMGGKMPRRTNQFQQLIHAIHLQLSKGVKVTESKFLRNCVTGEEREVDIVIEAETSLYPIVIGIECCQSRRPATIEWVERMIEKHRDLTDNKLVLVSGSGFTPTALQKAELEGVEALTLGASQTVDWTEVVGKLAQVYIALPQVRATNVGVSPSLGASLLDLDAELFTNEGEQIGSLREIADTSYRVDSVLEYILRTFTEPGNYLFGLDYTPPPGSHITDKAGVTHTVELLRVAVSVHLDERIAVGLRHAVFKDSQVAYGTLQVEDLQGLLTIVEAPGRPMSADLRLSPSTKKKR